MKKEEIKIPRKPALPEAKLKELKNKSAVKCRHCGEPLDLNDVKFLKADRAQVACTNPDCGGNNFLSRSRPAKPVQAGNKVRMSKKDRKRAKAIEKGWAE